jgi:hypothetical protein
MSGRAGFTTCGAGWGGQAVASVVGRPRTQTYALLGGAPLAADEELDRLDQLVTGSRPYLLCCTTARSVTCSSYEQ